jgi:hypothetical protein
MTLYAAAATWSAGGAGTTSRTTGPRAAASGSAATLCARPARRPSTRLEVSSTTPTRAIGTGDGDPQSAVLAHSFSRPLSFPTHRNSPLRRNRPRLARRRVLRRTNIRTVTLAPRILSASLEIVTRETARTRTSASLLRPCRRRRRSRRRRRRRTVAARARTTAIARLAASYSSPRATSTAARAAKVTAARRDARQEASPQDTSSPSPLPRPHVLSPASKESSKYSSRDRSFEGGDSREASDIRPPLENWHRSPRH